MTFYHHVVSLPLLHTPEVFIIFLDLKKKLASSLIIVSQYLHIFKQYFINEVKGKIVQNFKSYMPVDWYANEYL